MAEEEEKETTEEEGASGEKKSSNMLMIIIIVVLILIILIGAVVAIMMLGGEEESSAATQTPQAKERSVQSAPRQTYSDSDISGDSRSLAEIGILYPLDTFTVNLKSDSGRRYLKVTMSLELDGEELSIELDAKSAVLRDRIIRILTSKTLEEISSKKGKAKVTNQIMDILNSMIVDGRIKGIYFTEFVIQ